MFQKVISKRQHHVSTNVVFSRVKYSADIWVSVGSNRPAESRVRPGPVPKCRTSDESCRPTPGDISHSSSTTLSQSRNLKLYSPLVLTSFPSLSGMLNVVAAWHEAIWQEYDWSPLDSWWVIILESGAVLCTVRKFKHSLSASEHHQFPRVLSLWMRGFISVEAQ